MDCNNSGGKGSPSGHGTNNPGIGCDNMGFKRNVSPNHQTSQELPSTATTLPSYTDAINASNKDIITTDCTAPGFIPEKRLGIQDGAINPGNTVEMKYAGNVDISGGPFPSSTTEMHTPCRRDSSTSTSSNISLGFSSITIRQGFIRKVLGILMCQLLVTSGIIALFVLHDGIKSWIKKNLVFIVGAGALAIISTFLAYGCKRWRRMSPANFILLGIVTLAYSVLAASVAAYYSVASVLYATGLTVAVTLALTLFALQTKFKFTAWSGFWITILTLAILGGTVALLVKFQIVDKKRVLPIVWAFIGALFLSLILVYDLKRVVKGKHGFSLSPEEYVMGALGIYIDVLLIFIVILILVGIGENSDGCKSGTSGGSHGARGYYGGHGYFACCVGDYRDEEEEERRRRRNEGYDA